MVEKFQTTPFEERESQNPKVSDYAKDVAWGMLPLASMAGGYL